MSTLSVVMLDVFTLNVVMLNERSACLPAFPEQYSAACPCHRRAGTGRPGVDVIKLFFRVTDKVAE